MTVDKQKQGELLPCPFCGSDGELFERYKTPRPLWGVRCSGNREPDGYKCFSLDPADRTVAACVTAWNTRIGAQQ